MTKKNEIVPYRRDDSRARIVTVSGGKGGIGKTFFAVNFGSELRRKGHRVLIFDADINLSNVNLFLNIDVNTNFGDFLNSGIPISDLIQKGVGGVDALYAGNDLDTIFTLEEQDLNRIIGGLNEIESDYDYVIIDTQAGLSDLNFRLMLHSDINVLITTPEITALVDLYKVIKICSERRPGIRFDLVINRVSSAQEALEVYNKVKQTVSQFEVRTSLNFLGFIKEDPKRVFESIQKRVPIVVLHQSGSITECFRLLTGSFLKNRKPKRKFSFLYGLLGR